MSDVVGSAAFELRATRDKIPADLEAARREIEESAKKTEAALAEIVGSGTEKGSKRAAAAIEVPKAAGEEAGRAIRDAMAKAGDEIGNAVAKGSARAKAELDQLALKAREVQQIKLPSPTVPTEATHTLVTNPVNGVQGWVPNDVKAGSDAQAARMQAATEKAKDLQDALKDIEPAAETGSEGLGKVGKGSLMAGVAIGALIGGAILVTRTLWEMGRAAMQSAADIDGQAKKIGVSTDALQEYRFIATKIGEDAGAADRALGSFAEKLASATSGLSKEDVKSFGALLLDPDDLKKFKSTEEALDEVLDRIGQLKSESDRAAIAEKLGLGPLAVAIREGADEVANLRDEARELGVVMSSDLIRRGAEAQAQYESLSRIIDVQLKTAFIDLAPVIVTAIGLVAELAKALNDALQGFKDLESKSLSGLQAHRANLQAGKDAIVAEYGTTNLDRQTAIGNRVRPDGSVERPSYGRLVLENTPIIGPALKGIFAPRQNVGERFDNLTAAIAATDAQIARLQSASTTPTRTDRAGGTDLVLPPTRQRVDRSAEREARRAERVEQEILKARIRALGIVDEETMTVQQRFDASTAQLALERQAEKQELDRREARKDITAAERADLDAANKEVELREDRVRNAILLRDLDDERIAQERMLGDLTAELLSLQSGAARSAAARRAIELDLLKEAQRRAREDMLKNPKFQQLSPAQQASAISTQDQIFAEQTNGVLRNTMGPLEAWRDRALTDAGEIKEAYERIAVDGLDALNSGIVDAIVNSRNLGEVFSNVARQIIADLAAIAVRQSITEPLARMLFGGGQGSGSGGSGIGSFVKSLFSKLPGFAGEGTILPGPDSQVVAFRKMPSEQVDIYDPNKPRGGAPRPGGAGYVARIEPSKYFDAVVKQVAAPGAMQAGVASYQASEAQRQRAVRIAPYSRNG